MTRGPLRERRWGQLMVTLYRDGRQAEALEAFGRLRRVLDEDLGVVPGAELSLLHQAILRHSPELAWRPPPRDAPGYFGRRYPLEAANDAIDDLRHNRIRGRAVLIPG